MDFLVFTFNIEHFQVNINVCKKVESLQHMTGIKCVTNLANLKSFHPYVCFQTRRRTYLLFDVCNRFVVQVCIIYSWHPNSVISPSVPEVIFSTDHSVFALVSDTFRLGNLGTYYCYHKRTNCTVQRVTTVLDPIALWLDKFCASVHYLCATYQSCAV